MHGIDFVKQPYLICVPSAWNALHTPSQTYSPHTDQNNLTTFNTQLKDVSSSQLFLQTQSAFITLPSASTAVNLTSITAHQLYRITCLCVSSNRSMFLVTVLVVVSIIVPILQMRNQRLRKMNQFPQRSHTYSSSTRVPIQAVSQTHTTLQEYSPQKHQCSSGFRHLHCLQSTWAVLYKSHTL